MLLSLAVIDTDCLEGAVSIVRPIQWSMKKSVQEKTHYDLH